MSYSIITYGQNIKMNMIINFNCETQVEDLCDFIEEFLGCEVKILSDQSLSLKGHHSIEAIDLSVKNFGLCA